MKAIYAGSFSPPTLGHMDIITRAAELFDEVIVAVLSQAAKKYLFSPEERLEDFFLTNNLDLRSNAAELNVVKGNKESAEAVQGKQQSIS